MMQFPELRAILLDDEEYKRRKIMSALSMLAVEVTGYMYDLFDVASAVTNQIDTASPLGRANIVFLDGNITGNSSGCGDGNELLKLMYQNKVAYPLSLVRDRRFPVGEVPSRIVIGCSDDPVNAYANALEGALYRQSVDSIDDLAVILHDAREALGLDGKKL